MCRTHSIAKSGTSHIAAVSAHHSIDGELRRPPMAAFETNRLQTKVVRIRRLSLKSCAASRSPSSEQILQPTI